MARKMASVDTEPMVAPDDTTLMEGEALLQASSSSSSEDDSKNIDGSVMKARHHRKLNELQRQINLETTDKSKKRLLQNRKSALKCKLREKRQMQRLRQKVRDLRMEKDKLKEQMSAVQAMVDFREQNNQQLRNQIAEIES